MIQTRTRSRVTPLAFALAALVALGLAPGGLVPGAFADPPPPASLDGVPGHVDFEALGLAARSGAGVAEPDGEGEGVVRIALHGPMLRLVAAATRSSEPEFSDIIDRLRGIRAEIYTPAPERVSTLRRTMTRTARRLEGQGWQTVVEIRSAEADTSFLQILTDGETVRGIAVMFLETDGSAGYVNVVGEVTADQIAAIGRMFEIEPLERMGRTTDDTDGPPAERPDPKDSP